MITPGKWRTGPINYADVYAENGDLVALIIKNDNAVDNARLISKAPEILRRLKIMCREWREAFGGPEDNRTPGDVLELSEALIKQAEPSGERSR